MKNTIEKIPFNKPYLTGKELNYISEAHLRGQLSGDGKYTKLCEAWLENLCNCKKALLTNSCTAALEMSALLCDIGYGDEVIMPSYTFVSTANAFVLRGAIPVFVDIRIDTLNIDENKIEELITSKTKAIVVVHYAGIACEMDKIMEIAKNYKLFVIEDAAQACLSYYKGKPLGSIGDLGCFSFHETKNIISGEGGALIINNQNMIERAEIIREKGTNRKRFTRGKVDKYTWTDIGSSYLPGEIISAFLWAQMQDSESIIIKRKNIWNYYELYLSNVPEYLKTPTIPNECEHNGHMYYVINKTKQNRNYIIEYLSKSGINCVFHYIPLHSSPYGQQFNKHKLALPVTDFVSDNILRLPIWIGLDSESQKYIIENLLTATQ